jgi:hypothetical protein
MGPFHKTTMIAHTADAVTSCSSSGGAGNADCEDSIRFLGFEIFFLQFLVLWFRTSSMPCILLFSSKGC